MGSMGDDLVAAVDMAAKNYLKLKQLDPENNLLKFVSEVTRSSVKLSNEHIEEFTKIFPTKHQNPGCSAVYHPVYAWINYYSALEKEISRLS